MKRMTVLLVGVSLLLASCTNTNESINRNTQQTEIPSKATATSQVTPVLPSPTMATTPVPTWIAEEDEPIKLLSMEGGFQLRLGDNERADEWYTTTMENGTAYSVHIVTTEDPGNGEGIFARTAIVVHPESGTFRSYPLFRANTDNSYALHSIAKAYGFVDDRSLMYISVHNDNEQQDTYYYSANKLDILTGEVTEIIPRIKEFEDISDSEHLAKGWITETGETLMLNSYSEGKLWALDFSNEELSLLPISAKHHWPFYMTSVSPDGERIWHFDSENNRFVLIDNDGGTLTSLPIRSDADREQVGWFFWSPNGKYAVNYPSSTTNKNNVIHENSEFVTKAMDRITFYDREGGGKSVIYDKSSSPYVEVAGWLGSEDEYAVLRFYDLEGDQGVRDIVNESYTLFEVESGQSIGLKEGKAGDEMNQYEPVISFQSRSGIEEPVLLVDRESQQIVMLSERGDWIVDKEQSSRTMAWIRQDETGESVFVSWTKDGSLTDIQEQRIEQSSNNGILVGESWVALQDMTYIRVD
ncbi:NHL repeat-containing protein [Paenibacillus sp. strain BS8-2]